jgi:putative Mg2+ transporter-C (MgtC) family protein
MISHVEMISRIALGALLGGAIGFERDIHGRPAGLRTHLLVSMGSATFMVVSTQFFFFQGYDSGSHVEVDVSRIAASVVSGIGFLAGGAILKTGVSIQGLTTAAALWLAAAIGLCAGGGMYAEGIAVTLMGLVSLTVFRTFEDKDDKSIHRYVSLTLEDSSDQIEKIMAALTGIGAEVPDFNYERRTDPHELGLTFEVNIPKKMGTNGLIRLLEKQQGVKHVYIRIRDHAN